MPTERRILVNALCVGSGGVYTVARELTRHLALVRPGWRLDVAVTRGAAWHERLRAEPYPPNVRFVDAPRWSERRARRALWERLALPRLARRADAVAQLNGMVVPALASRTLSHCGDPWPYLPEAWDPWYDPLLAFGRRRGHAQAMRRAACMAFTSAWMRDLLTRRLAIEPKRAVVLHNGVPPEWIERAAGGLPPWTSRPMEIVSVGNVSPYKRQEDVIRALPLVLRRPGLGGLTYRVIGHCDDGYRGRLQRLVDGLNLRGRVRLEGRVDEAAMQTALRSARAFVLPSLCESFCIPAIEAMSFGAPVVVADAAALPEIVGDAALRCRPGDVPDLAECIAQATLDVETAETLRRRGAARIGRFSWRTTAERAAEELERIAASESGRDRRE